MDVQNTNQNADPAAGQGTGERTFSQEDVNRIVQDRLAKDREKASRELGEKEQELAQREFRLNSRQKLIDKGYPETLLDALNCSSEEAFDKALGIIDGLMEERLAVKKDDEKQAQLEALHQMNLPAVDFFLENCLPAYELTLDELNLGNF